MYTSYVATRNTLHVSDTAVWGFTASLNINTKEKFPTIQMILTTE